MKLTGAQVQIMRALRERGAIVSGRTSALKRLEDLRLIESDPATLGVKTIWKLTKRGQRVELGES